MRTKLDIYLFIHFFRMLIFVLGLVYYGVRCETLLDGNLTVAGLFTIQNGVNGECSGISPSSVKILEAVKWIFKNLNEQNYIPGVTIGKLYIQQTKQKSEQNKAKTTRAAMSMIM